MTQFELARAVCGTFCVFTAPFLMYKEREGWGWLLFVAVILFAEGKM